MGCFFLVLSPRLVCATGGIPGLGKIRQLVRGLARPNAPDEVPPWYLGAEPVGDYQRRTQSPVVWLNLRKAKSPQKVATWHNVGYETEAKQRLAEIGEEIKASG